MSDFQANVNQNLQFLALKLYVPETPSLANKTVLATSSLGSEIAVSSAAAPTKAPPVNNPVYWLGATGVILAIAFLLRVLLPVMLQNRTRR